jgi:SNF2 family DNA or RNA helicase
VAEKYQYKTQPYDKQREALRKAWLRPGFAYFAEMGVGKTKIVIDEICMLYEAKLIDGAVISAPKGGYSNWDKREIPAHMPDQHFERSRVVRWNSGGPNYASRMQQVLSPYDGLRILIINTEAFSGSSLAENTVRAFLQSGRMYFAVDESTGIKNPDAHRSKVVVRLGRLAAFRRILNGNPTPRSPLDLYSQFDFLGPRLIGHSSYYSFRARYAVLQKKNFGPKGRAITIVVGYKNVEELNGVISPHSFRARKSECLDLPPKVYESREVEMTDVQKRMYVELKKKASTEHDGHFITATETIARLVRQQQILCGYGVDENGEKFPVPTNRLTALMGMLEENEGKKVIIWSRFRDDVTRIREAIAALYGERSVVAYMGGVDQREKDEAIDRFQTDPECLYFAGTPASGGRMLTLTAAEIVAYYCNDDNLDNRLQSEDRAHRGGQTKTVVYVDFFCPNTLEDLLVFKSLRTKINFSTIIMGDEYQEWLI